MTRRRLNLSHLTDKIDEDTNEIKNELAKSSQGPKRQINFDTESQYKDVQITDPASIEETTITKTKNLELTQSLLQRLEKLEYQQTNDISPRFSQLEEKIQENAKSLAELIELLKNQPKVEKLDIPLEPEPQPEPDPQEEPEPELPPLPELPSLNDEEDNKEEVDEELPPLPEIKLPESLINLHNIQPTEHVAKMDSETQTEKVETDEKPFEILKEREVDFEIENQHQKVDDVVQVQEKQNEPIAEQVKPQEVSKSTELKPSHHIESGNKLSIEFWCLLVLIILEVIHLIYIFRE